MSESTTWHVVSEEEALKRLGSDRANGISKSAAAERLAQYGRNAFPEEKKKSLFAMFFEQFTDFLVIILIVATIISLFMGEVTDAIVIMAVLIVNAIIGVAQEQKANAALAALKKMTVPLCEVIRDGAIEKISSEEVVPGDLIILREGDLIAADLRLTETYNLRVDEASMTGESVPVEKDTKAVAEGTDLADRTNMAYAGTAVVYGRARGVAVATGMEREIGRIAKLMMQEETTETPLQQNLAGLGKMLGLGAIVICALVFLIGVFRDSNLIADFKAAQSFIEFLKHAVKDETILNMFLTAVSLAVAAIPEGLPAIVTIVLAVGVYRMSKQRAIVRKLPAVETLGCATYICSDKTGTLTENRMTIQRVMTMQELLGEGADGGAKVRAEMMLASVLCNDSHIDRTAGQAKRYGDPTELAFVDYAEKEGMNVAKERENFPRLQEVPFDSNRKMMSTMHLIAGRHLMLVKGAPNAVLDNCATYDVDGRPVPLTDEKKNRASAAIEEMAEAALRVLAFAWKEVGEKDAISANDERGLVFVGFAGMIDPPREEVKLALRECADAGISCAMITGDHAATARAIAAGVGMFKEGDEVVTGAELEKMSDEELNARVKNIRVFARVWPEQKLRIVKALQENHQVVAMTGDGVNDAPALKKADIGVAMGITGTEVAKGASEVILTDDNFATIVHAIREGRVIFDNIRKFVMYLLACNVGEIFSIFVPVLIGLHSPLRPVQLLLVNLVTDGIVALSLGIDKPEHDIMRRPPRHTRMGIIGASDLVFIFYNAIFIAAAVITVYVIGERMTSDPETGKTMAFVTLCFAELWRAFSFRSFSRNVWQYSPFSNMFLIWACLISGGIVLATILIEPLRRIFGNFPLTGEEWALALGFSIIPLIASEMWTLSRRKLGRGEN